jgi:hypothetical protein
LIFDRGIAKTRQPRRRAVSHEHDRDKVITRPYLGREAVRFSSILHADLKGRTAAAG